MERKSNINSKDVLKAVDAASNAASRMSKGKGKRKKKKNVGWKLIFLLIVLVLLFLILCLITPTEVEYGLTSSGLINSLELPSPLEGHQIVAHTGYTLSYNEEYEVPDWVAYELTRDEVAVQAVDRKDNFRADAAITTLSADLNDYKGSGFDRGHMAPAADFRWSPESMDDTFFLSNMCPQTHAFNAGIWSDLESAVRTMAYDNETIYVVTGPVLTDGPYETIGKNKVAVPKRFYKVILDYTDPGIKAIGFLMDHENSKQPLSTFAVTVDEVERVTGIDFFPLLPDEEEELIESTLDLSQWSLRAFNPQYATGNAENLNYVQQGQGSGDTTLDTLKLIFVDVFMAFKKEVFKTLGITKEARLLGLL
ncbi:MAG: DNA/RNA non-specific endonuclease [Spirochaetales bacterium]|nr:DNA/RNA non-specific endonuclease [Candidatus Physcosoma equi]